LKANVKTQYKSHLNEKDFVVDKATFNFGSGGSNPMDNVKFYDAVNREESYKLEKHQVSHTLSDVFEEHEYRLFYKNNDPDKKEFIEDMQRVFKEHVYFRRSV
jgi:hypothetical protein